jgi:hypothetical protein
MNLLTKTLLAAAIAGAATQAYANQFYIDTAGTGVGRASAYDPTVCATCSSLKNQATFSYQSQTTIFVDDPTNIVGDPIQTFGGLAVGEFADNFIGSFIPASLSAGLTSDQGTINDGIGFWGLSFSFDLLGEITAATGLLVEEVSYNSGLIEIFAMLDDGAGGLNAVNIFDMSVTGSDNSNPSNFVVLGNISFSGNEDAAFADFFNLAGVSCGASSSFTDLVNCVPPVEVSWRIDQNLDNEVAIPGPDGTFIVAGDHDGSISFAASTVPVPAPVLLMGVALIGMVGVRRKFR